MFCLGDGVQDLENISGLQAYAKSITAAPVDEITIKLRALEALFTGQPLSVAALNETKLHDAIRRKFAELRPDLIIVYSCNMAQFAEHLPGVPRIMHFGDLDSLKWQQYAERSSIPLNWIYAIEAQRLLGYERHIAQIFSHALVHTEIEKHDFERLIPGIPVTVVGNGVDLDYFRSAGEAKQPASMVFTGVMDYRPNIDAVVWFCNEILPIVQTKIPAANFTICGSRPAPAVRRLAKMSRCNGNRLGSGRTPLSRSSRSLRRAVANGARRAEQAARGARHGAALCRFDGRLEGHGRRRRGRHPRDGRPAGICRACHRFAAGWQSAGGDGAQSPGCGRSELPLGGAAVAPRSGYCAAVSQPLRQMASASLDATSMII